jgi:4-amino-4-deoxy-L-arabinose transferase-like glycosyltransferase
MGIALAITLIALGIRTYHLDQLPSGLHGDEAAAGLDAERILRDGNIGPYSPLTLGRPTLPLYLTAPAVALLGNTVVAIRIVEALAGTLTVLALFVILWRHAGLLAASFGAALLAGLTWHLHLSRTGFNGATWVLFAVLSVGALLEAVRRERDWRWWAAAGILSGLAIYTYQAEWLFLGVIGLFLAGYVAWTIWRERQLAPLGGAILWLGLTLLVGLPMILFALDPDSGYFGYFGIVSVFDKPEWQALGGLIPRLQYLAGRYADFWVRGCCHPVVDGTDGTGVTPLIPLAILALALIGVGIGIWRRRGPLVWIGLLVLVLVPVGAVGTLDGPARRTFALAAFLALLAGLGLAELVRLVPDDRLRLRISAVVGTLVVVVALGYQGVADYFTKFPGTPGDRWVYVTSLTNAARYMGALPSNSYVYFAADRWSIHYETIRYLAPNLHGEDRLSAFGTQDLTVDPANGAPVFVLMDQHRARVDELERIYPGGTVTTVGPAADPDFIAYSLPPAS